MSVDARLEELDKKMRAEGRLLSQLANRGKFGRAFKAVTKRYDELEAAWRKIKREGK